MRKLFTQMSASCLIIPRMPAAAASSKNNKQTPHDYLRFPASPPSTVLAASCLSSLFDGYFSSSHSCQASVCVLLSNGRTRMAPLKGRVAHQTARRRVSHPQSAEEEVSVVSSIAHSTQAHTGAKRSSEQILVQVFSSPRL